ncbi:4Fe-4S_ferredoxin iron-sulfur binding domain protein [Hexamita inflata]|uniref:4Fe-4S ferredoxin iron-sulfur binding domain protein n=1 Tax=Hexamita inflata TaxID=28002 RepID=A0AA86PIP0_9EUKA|nr:4Fe-4S ferredoxin iron-sulfur binding domain protein [Hexamita inflata]
MKVGVIIGSITGNTENFAHVIMDELKKQDPTLTFEEYMINLEMNKKNTQENYEYPNCDAYLIGAYTDCWTMPYFVRQYLEQMPLQNIKDKMVFTFTTCGAQMFNVQYDFEQLLGELNAKIVAHVGTCYPGNFVKMPVKKWYRNQCVLKLFNVAPECQKFVTAVQTGEYSFVPKTKGITNDFMRKNQNKTRPLTFVTLDSCIGCGTCVENCPSAIINLKDGKAVFTEQDKCVGCYACFQKCPVHAVVDEKKTLANKLQYKFDNSYIVEKPKSNSMLKAFIFVTFMMLTVMLLK